MKVLAIAFGVIVLVLLLASVLEKTAKPLSDERAGQLSRWIMVAVFASIVVALLQQVMGG